MLWRTNCKNTFSAGTILTENWKETQLIQDMLHHTRGVLSQTLAVTTVTSFVTAAVSDERRRSAHFFFV